MPEPEGMVCDRILHPIKHQNPAMSPWRNRQRRERGELYLYRKVPPLRDPIPINIEPFDINDSVPEADVEIRAVVAGMRNGRAGDSRGIKTEHLKIWLRGIQEEE